MSKILCVTSTRETVVSNVFFVRHKFLDAEKLFLTKEHHVFCFCRPDNDKPTILIFLKKFNSHQINARTMQTPAFFVEYVVLPNSQVQRF